MLSLLLYHYDCLLFYHSFCITMTVFYFTTLFVRTQQNFCFSQTLQDANTENRTSGKSLQQ